MPGILPTNTLGGAPINMMNQTMPPMGQQPNQERCQLYVSNLGEDINDTILNEHFSRFGQVMVAIKHNHFTGESRGFGFVTYNNSKSAQEAKE